MKSVAQNPNHLIDETSTYLRQHAYNPVAWYPWGKEALQKAADEDKPILLSIGYAACHWCHVMAHESFEDVETAKLMNKHFVNIKVDREERTDLDEIYMKAVQMITGHGGWPMTVFLTPQLKPFFGGTYYPPDDRHGLPGFKKLLTALADAWKDRREEIEKSAGEITKQLHTLEAPQKIYSGNEIELDDGIIEQSVIRLLDLFDPVYGGFGGAPKFPHTFNLALIMRYFARGGDQNILSRCSEVISKTLDRMAAGGIHDQLGGGFARYSVDRQWLVPHFEKMLYDNALLALVYLDGYLIFDKPFWARTARGIFQFLLSELRTDDGAFYSSLDADSEGEEGKYYVWTAAELKELLDSESYTWFAQAFGITDKGNFEQATNVLHLATPANEEQFWHKFEPIRAKLLAARSKRIAPGLDEKVLTSWNSLTISALVHGYRVLAEKSYLDAAKTAAGFILNKLMVKDRLLRTYGQGKARLNGYLDDYAFFIAALIDLAAVDPDPRWLVNAIRLTEVKLQQFFDDRENCLFYTGNDHEKLVTRPQSYYDGSVPSGTSVAVQCLLKLSKLTDNRKYEAIAKRLLKQYARFATKIPDQFANLLCALDEYLHHNIEITCLAPGQSPESIQDFILTINKYYIPNKVMLVDSIASGAKNGVLYLALKEELKIQSVPLLEAKRLHDGQPTIYICRNYTCREPITDLDKLEMAARDLSHSIK